jgi:hypothetical protein
MATSGVTASLLPQAPGRPARFRAWIARHPFVFVALLTPGIVEYLSGSSVLAGLILAPPLFFLFLAANLGLYVPGVLLIREARIRWRGGWGTVLLLGIAYAILEEGLALSTLFDPNAPVVGVLGTYGHFAGVSWVWLVGIVAVHVVFSISVPIYLLDLALPSQKGTPWLSGRRLPLVISILALDTAVLVAFTEVALHFFAGPVLIGGALLAIGGLAVAAHAIPGGVLQPRSAGPLSRPFVFALVGSSFWPGILIAEALGGAAGLPAAGTVALTALLLVGYLAWFLARIGREGNARQLLALAAGLIAPLMVAGALAQLRVPVVLVADAAAIWFFWHLWVRYRPQSVSAPPAGAAFPA